MVHGPTNGTTSIRTKIFKDEASAEIVTAVVSNGTPVTMLSAAMAKQLGWRTIVADARAKFATHERLPSADEIIVAWPEEALAQIKPDHQTAIVVLTHDEKFDLPAIIGALGTDCFYIGALGSRKNQEKRRVRLLEAGIAEEQLSRICGPCGLDLGADSQPETALSILAEAVAIRAGRDGGRLQGSKGRIHVGVE